MARNKPTILIEQSDKTGDFVDQVIYTEALYIVLYKGKPFNLKHTSVLSDAIRPIYKKTSYTQKGHAENLARKLNKKFNCDDFTVHRLTDV